MNLHGILAAITMSAAEKARRDKLDKAWGEYVTAQPWMNQPGYIPDAFRIQHYRKANGKKAVRYPHDEWLCANGVTPLAPRASGERYTNVASTGQYDYDGNLPDLTLMEVARAFGFPTPDSDSDGDNMPDTSYVTTDAHVAHELLHRGAPLQPPLKERTATRRGSFEFINPGNTTAAAAWWPALSDAQQVTLASTFIVWWRAMQELQRQHVSETYQPMRYEAMVGIKEDTERRERDTVRYPGEKRDNDGNLLTCITKADNEAAQAQGQPYVDYVTAYDAQHNMVRNGAVLRDAAGHIIKRALGEEGSWVQGHGTFSREYLAERTLRTLVAQYGFSEGGSCLDEGQLSWWEVSDGDGEDDALNSAYVKDLKVQEALRLAWEGGSNHNHKDGMRRCMAIIQWAQRLFGNYVAAELLDYFDTTLLGAVPYTVQDELRAEGWGERFEGERKTEWREEEHDWRADKNARTQFYLKPESPKPPKLPKADAADAAEAAADGAGENETDELVAMPDAA